MALTQMLYSLDNKQILQSGTLISEQELEDTLCENIQLLDSNWLVIGQQIITANGKRLDLLCIDRCGSLIVLELKKDLTPREVTAQVIEYASYVSEMGFEELAQAYLKFAEKHPGVPDSLDKAFLHKFGTELDESLIKSPRWLLSLPIWMMEQSISFVTYARPIRWISTSYFSRFFYMEMIAS